MFFTPWDNAIGAGFGKIGTDAPIVKRESSILNDAILPICKAQELIIFHGVT
jgi:hypothetical protein